MNLEELIEDLVIYRVGTNRAEYCWEMKTPLPDDKLDILNAHAESLELELDETDYVSWPGRKPFHIKKVYRILFTQKKVQ